MTGRREIQAADGTKVAEFAAGWRTLLCASWGVGLGVAGLLTYNSGLFVGDLAREFGLSRTAYGVAFFASTAALAAAMPFVGAAVDRYGPRWVAAVGAACLSAGFAALGLTVRSVEGYGVTMVLIGLLAAACSPVPYTRAVTGRFVEARGLALGLTQVGIGIAAAIVPPLVSAMIAHHGWRSGYLTLAGLAALGILPALGLPGRTDSVDMIAGTGDFRRTRLFKAQLCAFVLMALAFAGILAHFVPMLRDAGLSIQQAGAMAGLIGMSVIVMRVIVGWLSDVIEPALLGALSCAVCATGCLCLTIGGASMAVIGALSLGAAMGAEADLVGMLTARHFGVSAYSRAYALQYAAFMLAAGVSPIWVGALADATGSYRASLIVATIGLFAPTILFALLPTLRGATGRQECERP